jgi:RHS repeat-associated protein
MSYTNQTDSRYKFTEKERDLGTNYDYFGARYYDSELGRWQSVDPLADKYPGWSPYNYCLNNPLVLVDPEGMDSYVYYDPDNFEDQAKKEAERLKKLYGTEVHLIAIKTEKEFKNNWSSMNEIDGVSLLFHGSSQTINIDWKNNEYLTISPDGKTPSGNEGTYLGALDQKDIKQINLLICQGGNLDEPTNVASYLSDKFQTRVNAWDGKLSYSNDGNYTPQSSGLANISFVLMKGRQPEGGVTYSPGYRSSIKSFHSYELKRFK